MTALRHACLRARLGKAMCFRAGRNRAWDRRDVLDFSGPSPRVRSAIECALPRFRMGALIGTAALLCAHLLGYKILIRNLPRTPGIQHEAVGIAVPATEENNQLFPARRACPCD